MIMKEESIYETLKKSSINITITDSRLDDAQYLMMMILQKYNISNLKVDHFGSLLKGSFDDVYGILIGNISNMYGEFEFYLNGVVKATNAEGEDIDTADKYKKYLLEDKVLDLHFDSRAYIYILNRRDINKYYGVFERLGDAIKVAMENDLVKTGEVFS